ncbi:rheacalcin-2-like [Falco cherrug]|uniref:rheacalcin-2-like n=1 Tax=Falco cherrug TaxID=345164 RepID=UPI00247B16A3|nr:rheacalcin-2-like [Falco cherrug]
MEPTRTLRLGLLGCLLFVPWLRGECRGGGDTAELAACAWGWVPFNEGCYSFFPRELSWRRAEAFCQRFGTSTHLASVHSAEEHRAIAALLSSSYPGKDSEEEDEDDGIWIGLHRPLGSRRWQWSDSSEVDYGSWHQQPGPRRRACAALQDGADFMTWYSDACSERKPFVCKSSA